MNKGKTFCQLHEEERVKIEVLLQQGLSISSIARQLGRPICTISREIKRNGPVKYVASKAHASTLRRHRYKRKHIVFDQSMIDFIESAMQQKRWSPEIISVEGRKKRFDFVSHEWIYRWVWAMKFSLGKKDQKYRLLYQYLKHGKRRKRRGMQRCNRGNILQRQWIEHRPERINKRKRKGDMEADIVLGKDRKPGLLVILDRKTRKTWIRRLKTRQAGHVMRKVKSVCQAIGSVKTITLDNDLSFAHHYKLHALGIDTYFTHPFSAQEK
jgi:IS30 family transposase